MYWKQLGLQGLPCLETIEIRTQNLSTIIKNHKAHTDTDINPDRQDKTSSSFPPEMEKISLSRFFWGVGVGLAARQALGRSSWFGIAYEKNQLSGFQGIKFPWKPTLSGSIEYHGPPRSGRLSFP